MATISLGEYPWPRSQLTASGSTGLFTGTDLVTPVIAAISLGEYPCPRSQLTASGSTGLLAGFVTASRYPLAGIGEDVTIAAPVGAPRKIRSRTPWHEAVGMRDGAIVPQELLGRDDTTSAGDEPLASARIWLFEYPCCRR